jgi:hypothetical protein
MKSFLIFCFVFLTASKLFAAYEVIDIEQELLNSHFEDSEEFSNFKQSLSSDLNGELDFIEQKTKEVTLFLEKNENLENQNIVEDEISDRKSAIKRSPAIEADELNFKSDDELRTLFEANENPRKPRRIRSR